MKLELDYNANHLSVEPLKYSYPDEKDGYGANLISTRIIIKAGHIHGEYIGNFETADFHNFKEGLERLYLDLKGFARFDGLEPYLTLKIQGDGIGHFNCECRAIPNPGYEQTELVFILHFDQTQIPELIKKLESILIKFPIRK